MVLNGGTAKSVTVTAAATADNTSLFNANDSADAKTLVGDFNAALKAAGLDGSVVGY